ncbi:MAG: class I SAM-dependent methyltransferase [Proteobacteria bacterium]|nr:class I SAM-dependent methyltransferase [Pseudomonadota bacterium]
MTLFAATVQAFEAAPVPDLLRRQAVAWLVAGARRRLARSPADIEQRFVDDMVGRPVAEHVEAANSQHYEVPSAFFEQVLGPRLKYSCCLYDERDDTLADAEVRALAETCEHADLKDGQSILELGCGWGSLSLWMAERYPNASITAVSNSRTQREHIMARAAERGLTNLDVVTADMNVFATEKRFDRVVSVEMFEHMSNWRELLKRVRGWLKPEGRAFIHVFTHRSSPYRFEQNDKSDWIAQHFFTGGIMPSHGLIRRFDDLMQVEAEWVWSGTHYQQTAMDWLANFDGRIDTIRPILKETYGRDARLWEQRWRLFFLATAGLFGDSDGREWQVSHYRLKRVEG